MTHALQHMFRALATAVAAAMIIAGTAFAQTGDYDEAKIDAFVEAVVKVTEIRQQWIPKIKAAGSEQESQKMNQQAVVEMRAAIDEVDNISAEQYDKIAMAMQKDKDLADRINTKFKQITGQ
jgi:hypothetical protein